LEKRYVRKRMVFHPEVILHISVASARSNHCGSTFLEKFASRTLETGVAGDLILEMVLAQPNRFGGVMRKPCFPSMLN